MENDMRFWDNWHFWRNQGCLGRVDNDSDSTYCERNVEWLTGDDQPTSGGTESGLPSELMHSATLVRLVSVLGSNVTDVQLTRGQDQILSIYNQPSGANRGGQKGQTSATTISGKKVKIDWNFISNHLAGSKRDSRVESREEGWVITIKIYNVKPRGNDLMTPLLPAGGLKKNCRENERSPNTREETYEAGDFRTIYNTDWMIYIKDERNQG